MNNVLDAKTGVKDTLPTMLGYVGIGTAFGIIAHTNGFSPLETFIMSLLVYTASGEFALVSMVTDETFALAITKLNYTKGKLKYEWLNAANLVAYAAWCLSSLFGALIGSVITDTKALGLDYAVVAMFLGLLYLQLITDQSVKIELQLVMIGGTMVLTYLGLIFLPASVATIVVTVVGCLVGMVIKHVFFE